MVGVAQLTINIYSTQRRNVQNKKTVRVLWSPALVQWVALQGLEEEITLALQRYVILDIKRQ